MTNVWFYHLERRTLDSVLPELLERALARGWRAVVQGATEKGVARLDDLLWSYDPESFLPHGTAADGAPETQPIYLTIDADNPNAADVRFFVEGARVLPALANPACAPRERAIVMLDGNDEAAVLAARVQWTELKQAGHAVSYYRRNDSGKWERA